MALNTHTPRHAADESALIGQLGAYPYYEYQADAVALAAAVTIDCRGKSILYVDVYEDPAPASTMAGQLEIAFAMTDVTANYETTSTVVHLVTATDPPGRLVTRYEVDLKHEGGRYARMPITTAITGGTITVWYAFG
jgi:hypothetical protein